VAAAARDSARGCPVPCRAVQASAQVQLQHAAAAHVLGGAPHRHHVGSDLGDDPVELLLRVDRLRHDLAEAAQENARATESASHQPVPVIGLLAARSLFVGPVPMIDSGRQLQLAV